VCYSKWILTIHEDCHIQVENNKLAFMAKVGYLVNTNFSGVKELG